MAKYCKVCLLLMLIYLPCVAFKEGYEWAQAWVKDEKLLAAKSLAPGLKEQIKPKELQLILSTKTDLEVQANGNTYLKCYLLNNTDTVTTVLRADATLHAITSQIFKNGVWMRFQAPYPVSCGNSYWKQQLPPGQAIAMQYDHDEKGPIKVPFRLCLYHNGRAIYSDQITVDIDQERFDKASPLKTN